MEYGEGTTVCISLGSKARSTQHWEKKLKRATSFSKTAVSTIKKCL